MNVHEKYIMDCCGAPHVGQPLKKDGDKPKFYHTFEISQSMSALCSYLDKMVMTTRPKNVISFMFELLLDKFPEETMGVNNVWFGPKETVMDRLHVARFFRYHRIPLMVSVLFIKSGFDNLEVISSMKPEDISQIEIHNNVTLLKGHKKQLEVLFKDIATKVRAYRRNPILLVNKYKSALMIAPDLPSSDYLEIDPSEQIAHMPPHLRNLSPTTIADFRAAFNTLSSAPHPVSSSSFGQRLQTTRMSLTPEFNSPTALSVPIHGNPNEPWL